ncbi:unnamed protein product [Soboliphyme baturini]|uniref:Uncharacterized protein n=1 Tax=Soboliphyme baturini TaxID=241478 RepID=A0A183IYN6_9BILA|nr:unnamed protein product [Soboliphyme baturini]
MVNLSPEKNRDIPMACTSSPLMGPNSETTRNLVSQLVDSCYTKDTVASDLHSKMGLRDREGRKFLDSPNKSTGLKNESFRDFRKSFGNAGL